MTVSGEKFSAFTISAPGYLVGTSASGGNCRIATTDVFNAATSAVQINAPFGGLAPATRFGAWDSNMVRSGATPSATGEEVAIIAGIAQETSSTVSYEKNGLVVWLFTQDPSQYSGPTITRDAVALDVEATILAGNTSGRAWSAFFGANIDTGADGAAYGLEITVTNDGANQADVFSPFSKINVILDCGGAFNTTAAIWMPGSGTFYNHIVGQVESLVAGGHFLLLQDSSSVAQFSVDAAGITYTKPVAVLSLPPAGTAGRRAVVNNATQTLTAGIGAVVASGGANVVPVFDDGTNWRIG